MGRGAGDNTQASSTSDLPHRPLLEEILAQRHAARSWEEIAEELGQTGVRTSRGLPGRDYVRRVVVDAAAKGDVLAQSALVATPVRRSGRGIGRPPVVSEELRLKVLSLYKQTRNLAEVKRLLEEQGVPAPRGGSIWYLATIKQIVEKSGEETLAGGWFQEEALDLIEKRLIGTSKHQQGRPKNQEKLVEELNRLGYPATKEGDPWTLERVRKAVRRHGLSPAIQNAPVGMDTESLILELVRDRGLTLDQVAVELNSAKVSCPWSEQWQRKTVARVLNMRRRRLRRGDDGPASLIELVD